MGHKVGYRHRPHRGSLQFWHRSRAQRQYVTPHWKETTENGASGFPVYKVGMTHVVYIDNLKFSMNKGKRVMAPVTILEAPPCKVIGVRFYKNTPLGKKTIGEIITRNADKHLKRKTTTPKKQGKNFDDYTQYDDLTLIIQTQPHLIGLKKTPEVLEMGIGGKIEEKKAYAKNMIDKEIKVTDALKEGMQVDIAGVTKGKGVQGSVKRFGILERNHKSDKVSRNVGALGPTSPRKVSWKVPQYGQMGYHSRVEYNKWILKIGEKPEEVNVDGGFKGYGKVKKDYIMIKGSIMGPIKRMVVLRKGIRTNDSIPKIPPQLKYVSLTSAQGGRT